MILHQPDGALVINGVEFSASAFPDRNHLGSPARRAAKLAGWFVVGDDGRIWFYEDGSTAGAHVGGIGGAYTDEDGVEHWFGEDGWMAELESWEREMSGDGGDDSGDDAGDGDSGDGGGE